MASASNFWHARRGWGSLPTGMEYTWKEPRTWMVTMMSAAAMSAFGATLLMPGVISTLSVPHTQAPRGLGLGVGGYFRQALLSFRPW